MNRVCMVLLILFLMLGGYTCSRFNDISGVESEAMEEVKSLEKKASGEVKKLEEDYRVLAREKDYKKYLEEEPKAPLEALEEGAGGVILGEGLASPPE